jgi:hypothetical protein
MTACGLIVQTQMEEIPCALTGDGNVGGFSSIFSDERKTDYTLRESSSWNPNWSEPGIPYQAHELNHVG